MSLPAGHAGRVRTIYKTILRLHRGLPPELSELGSAYTRDEFKRHKQCSDQEAVVFLTEWTNYAITIAKQLGLKGPKTGSRIGHEFDEEFFEQFREDQIAQLYQLLLAATGQDETTQDETSHPPPLK